MQNKYCWKIIQNVKSDKMLLKVIIYMYIMKLSIKLLLFFRRERSFKYNSSSFVSRFSTHRKDRGANTHNFPNGGGNVSPHSPLPRRDSKKNASNSEEEIPETLQKYVDNVIKMCSNVIFNYINTCLGTRLVHELCLFNTGCCYIYFKSTHYW